MLNKGTEKVPGAGSYVIPSTLSGPKIGMHARTDLVDKDRKKNIPGPGQYDLQNSPGVGKSIRAAAYSMGSSMRADMASTNKTVPAPGHYEMNNNAVKTSAPKFGFGSSKRPDITGGKKMQTPGPGNYKLPSKIGNVSAFQMPGQKAENKYV